MRSIEIEQPLDLRATLRPLHGRFDADGWWIAARTGTGPGSMRVSRDESHVFGEAWGPGAGWLLDRLGHIVGLDDDPSRFRPEDSLVADLHRRRPGWRFGKTHLVFDALLIAICAQKVTGREAGNAIRGLYRRFSDPAPGPHPRLRLPPDPARIAAEPYHAFHDLHLEKRRADVLKGVASLAGELDYLATSPTDTATDRLRQIPGVGTWTIAETLSVSHGDPDQVPVGDYHIKHLVVHHLTGKDRGTDEEMLDLLEPYRPHRGRVIRLLHTLGHAPKFGPRAASRDITRL